MIWWEDFAAAEPAFAERVRSETYILTIRASTSLT